MTNYSLDMQYNTQMHTLSILHTVSTNLLILLNKKQSTNPQNYVTEVISEMVMITWVMCYPTTKRNVHHSLTMSYSYLYVFRKWYSHILRYQQPHSDSLRADTFCCNFLYFPTLLLFMVLPLGNSGYSSFFPSQTTKTNIHSCRFKDFSFLKKEHQFKNIKSQLFQHREHMFILKILNICNRMYNWYG